MKRQNLRFFSLMLLLGAVMMLGACKKKAAPPPPPPPPPPAAPTASLSANPEAVNPGSATTLTWETTNATEVTIDALGTVPASGSRQVTPATSTTYRLLAKGPGGSEQATARVTVNQAAPPPPPAPVSNATDEELFSQNVKDIYFDYDKADIRSGEQSALQSDVAFLKQHPNMNFTIEGHCDSRGSTEYNLALGDNRANAVKSALVQAGIAPGRIQTISYGKEKPFCTEETEQCWQENRRGHFAYRK